MKLVHSNEGNKLAIAEETLRLSEEHFRTLFEESPVSISISTEGVTKFVNKACLRMFGYSDLSELAGTRQFLRIAPEFRNVVSENAAEHGSGMFEPHVFEIEGLRKNGTTFPLWIQAVRIRLDEELSIIAFLDDLTNRRLAENTIRESERRMTDIIDFLPDAAFVIDKEGRVIAWNGAIEKMTGVKAEDMIGKGNYEYALPF